MAIFGGYHNDDPSPWADEYPADADNLYVLIARTGHNLCVGIRAKDIEEAVQLFEKRSGYRYVSGDYIRHNFALKENKCRTIEFWDEE